MKTRIAAMLAAAVLAMLVPAGEVTRANGLAAIYVACEAGNTVSMVDISNRVTVADVKTPKSPHSIAVDDSGKFFYIVDTGSNTMSVLDVALESLVADVEVGKEPAHIALLPEKGLAYITNGGSNSVSVVDVLSRRTLRSIDVGRAPHGIVSSAKDQIVLVANAGSSDVSIIDAGNDQIKTTIPIPGSVRHLAYQPDTGKVYVAGDDGKVRVADVNGKNVVAEIAIGGKLGEIALSPDGQYAYVVSEAGQLHILNTASNTVERSINTGRGAEGLSIAPDGGRAFVANRTDNTISIVDLHTMQVSATIAVGAGPTGLALLATEKAPGPEAGVKRLPRTGGVEFPTMALVMLALIAIGGGLILRRRALSKR